MSDILVVYHFFNPKNKKKDRSVSGPTSFSPSFEFFFDIVYFPHLKLGSIVSTKQGKNNGWTFSLGRNQA